MKEERMAVLSMVEKGIITVDEAERLLHALEKQEAGELGRKIGVAMDSAGNGLAVLAKKLGEATERLAEGSKVVARKTGDTLDKMVEENKPRVKKAAKHVSKKMSEQADKLQDSIRQRRENRLADVEEELARRSKKTGNLKPERRKIEQY